MVQLNNPTPNQPPSLEDIYPFVVRHYERSVIDYYSSCIILMSNKCFPLWFRFYIWLKYEVIGGLPPSGIGGFGGRVYKEELAAGKFEDCPKSLVKKLRKEFPQIPKG